MFDKILDEAGDYLFQCQLFGQGEPLLDWPRSRAIIEKCHDRKIFTLLSTNCTLLNETIADELVTCGLDHLVCAIDGVSQSSYEQYRVGGRVTDAMAGLRRALDARKRNKSGIEIEWQFLIHKGNAHELDDARRMAADLGVYLRPSPLRGMEFEEHLREQWLPDADALDNPRVSQLMKGEPFYNWPCYFLWRSVVLNSNAKVARCLIYQNVAEYGSLNDFSFHDLVNHPSAQRARQLFQRGPVPDGAYPAPCANCSYFERHHGGPNLDKHQSLKLVPADGYGASFVPIDQLAVRPRRNAQLPPAEPVEAG